MPMTNMASGRRSGSTRGAEDDIDSALDSLGGISYIDGVPFDLDRSLQSALDSARIHLRKADELLAIPPPSSITDALKDDQLLADIGRLEKQVRPCYICC